MTNNDCIKDAYPLHWLIWHNDYESLKTELDKNEHYIEALDPRGRTPLMLAVTLGYLECSQILLANNADANASNAEGWTVVQEAVATGDPEMLSMVLEQRDIQRHSSRVGDIPKLLQMLKDVPDFYIEMKWEFTSWMPLVSRMCPSDVYRVYKQGSNVRIDTTLLGFDNTNWQRGDRSYIFKGEDDVATLMEIDHETCTVALETLRSLSPDAANGALIPSEDILSARLTAPICTNHIDTDKISFERNKSGIWGWRSDKAEIVNGYDCKVFGASNVEFVTRTRTEHLSEIDKIKARSPKSPFQNLLGLAENEEPTASAIAEEERIHNNTNVSNITAEEYFSQEDLMGRDIGRPKEMTTKVQKFRATLWLCEEYPLQLQQQIMPILDLMATMASPHINKLKDFITMHLPAGFPVKIEIPLFHVINARITFGNIFALETPVNNISQIKEESQITCIVGDECFVAPPHYVKIGPGGRRQHSFEDEDDLLQYAIQQSLIEAGSENDQVDIWEALRGQRPNSPSNNVEDEEKELQRAIQESLSRSAVQVTSEENIPQDTADSDLELALLLSQQAQSDLERERQREQQILQEILELSLTEK
ncbi:ankyrin repeat domain-containing protein 13D-like [Ctenocephalides felis]|uniref:ankyrin repeat domain-containing protein 13D-like n=1 Tax=Ctenocephalides felis TaxID=7515 RepID=UPI000E6E17F8|nr:ankyrin repeat domain-containing protein 13D-like [Ctenocephalides felis]